jgi:LacI family transcriptional regulator
LTVTNDDQNTAQPRRNLREVAERAGVAMSSVSRVLTDHPDVSPRMRQRVLAVVEELGYEPNLLAQSLRRGSTLSVGFVIRDISSPLFSEIALGAETELRSHGYSMLLTNSEGLPTLDAAHIRLFRQRRVDGLLLSLADEYHAETIEELHRVPVPVVLIDRDLPDSLETSAVLSDHASGIRAAVHHLVALGHRSIGLAGGPLNLRPGRELSAALEAVCAEAGVEAVVEAGPFSEEHGSAAAIRLLDRADPPTALIAGSNQILPGVLRAVRQRGIRIPSELSLVTFDDVRMLEFVEPPIAVVSREPVEMGREAAAILLRRLKGGPPEQTSIPTKFDPRASCAPPSR